MMLDRIKGWLGTQDVSPATAPGRPAAPSSPTPAAKELRPVDTVSLSSSTQVKQPATQVSFSAEIQSPPAATRPVQGRLAEVNTSDPQFQALLGRLFGDVRVASSKIG